MDSTTLHWAARRYLSERYEDLCQLYAELPNQGRAEDGYQYSPSAKRIFPRYNAVHAILAEVERLDPDRLPDVQPLAAALLRAADVAQSPFTQPPQGEVEAEAINDERRLFSTAVRTWMAGPALSVAPLAYRRVLTPEESSHWRARLNQRWGLRDMSWHPMLAGPVPPDVLVLAEGSMWERQGAARVRQALVDMGGRRVAELREHGANYLLDVELFAPTYTGAEGVWTDDSLDWIAFASHEGTVAFGGALASALPAIWPDLDNWRWSGW